MRYKGKELVNKNSTTVTFYKEGEPFDFIVSPLPLGWWNQMGSMGISTYPEPKKVALTDSKGVVVRSKTTGKAEVIDQLDDDYKQKCSLVSRRLSVLKLASHLRDDPNIVWDAVQPKTMKLEDWQIYADQLLAELEKTSLTEEEVAEILNAGEQSACVLDIEHVANETLLTPTLDRE